MDQLLWNILYFFYYLVERAYLVSQRRQMINVCCFLREAGMFAARSGPEVPLRKAPGTEQAKEHPSTYPQPTVLDREARLVPRRVRPALRGRSQKGYTGKYR